MRERLARELLREAREGAAELTHQELAERTGTVREIAGRALRQLAQEGLVRLERGRVVVLDSNGLARIGTAGEVERSRWKGRRRESAQTRDCTSTVLTAMLWN